MAKQVNVYIFRVVVHYTNLLINQLLTAQLIYNLRHVSAATILPSSEKMLFLDAACFLRKAFSMVMVE
jgi:hypothetical protein